MKKSGGTVLLHLGVWIWGGVTIFLAFGLLGLVVCSAYHFDLAGTIKDGTNPLLAGAFQALKAYGSMLGAVVGFSGLAWANFFQAAYKQPDVPPESSGSDS
jgi:hypothetical protein